MVTGYIAYLDASLRFRWALLGLAYEDWTPFKEHRV